MPRPTLKKRKDGRYVCFRDGLPFYGYSSSEAYAKRDAYDAEKARGIRHETAGITFLEYALKWLPIHRHSACVKSYNLYAGVIDSFSEYIGKNTKLKDVTRSDVIGFYNTLDRYSQSHIDKHVATLRGIFKSAVLDRVILVSPCEDVETPNGTTGTHRPLENWERKLVHQMVDKHRFGVAAMLMLYAGLRRGEVLAFNIDRDVDFENNRVYVREAVSFSNSFRGVTGSTKTDSGVRDLPLFAPLKECLTGRHGMAVSPVKAGIMTESAFCSVWNSYLFRMSVLRNGGVYPRWIGHRKEDKSLTEKEIKAIKEAWKPVKIQTHDFRHSFCTMICDAGVDIKTAMSWMGHSDEEMIRKIYDHLTDLRQKKAEKNTAAEIDKMLLKIGENVQTDVQSDEHGAEDE